MLAQADDRARISLSTSTHTFNSSHFSLVRQIYKATMHRVAAVRGLVSVSSLVVDCIAWRMLNDS